MSLLSDKYEGRIPAVHLAGFVLICTMMVMGSLDRVDFKPSGGGRVAAVSLALSLSLACVGPVCRVAAGWKKILSALFFSCAFYLQILYGLGAVVTVRDSAGTVERDIAGSTTSRHVSGGKRRVDADIFYIETSGLSGEGFSKFRITEKEYKSIPREVNVHVVLKRSFWGAIIERYTFLSADGKTISIDQ